MTGLRRVFVGLTCTLALAACGTDPTPTPAPACPTDPPTSVSAQATLEGAERATVTIGGAVEGEFAMELYGDQAPIATANFVALARCGFYDGITFHRVISGFVIQAGDPQTKENRGDFKGLGTGGPGYEFEIEPPAEGLRYDPYVVAMANDTRTNGSQFFIDPGRPRPGAALGRRLHDLRQGHRRHGCRRRHRRSPRQRPAARPSADPRDHRVDQHLGCRRGLGIARRTGQAALLCKGI